MAKSGPKFKPNKCAHLADGTVIVMLERRDGTVLPCRIDAADWSKIRGYRWVEKKCPCTSYAHTNIRKADGKKTTLHLHNLILPDAKEVDHGDGNGVNNRRDNLRPVTRSQNQCNSQKREDCTSQFKGVSWHKQYKKWSANIRVKGVLKFLGYFTSEVEAAKAYDAAALQHFGEFAKLNFPLEHAA